MRVQQRITEAERKGENPWPQLIDDWINIAGGTMIELADEVADYLGDSAGRTICNVYAWRKGGRKPTGSRADALAKVLADALDPSPVSQTAGG